MNRHWRNRLAIIGLAALTAMSLGAQDQGKEDARPDGKGDGTMQHQLAPEPFAKPGGSKGGSNGIFYHGGPVMLGTTNMHFIYYGNWSANSTLTTAQTILADFAQHFGGSPYYNINTTYFDGSNNQVANSVTFAGAVSVGSPFGNAITDANLVSIVASTNPTDPNGVYFVLTSPEVNETSGFCTQYCGFHTHATINGQDIKYSFVGDGARCPSACSAQTVTPNGNLDADEMANVISHEFEESTSDPDLNAWFDRRGQENADKCNFNFGATQTTSTGAQFNQTLGTRNYLIQQNWLNANGGLCVQHFP